MDRTRDSDEEYQFYPEDFEGDGTPADAADLAPLVIVGCLGVGVGLFLADPFVEPVSVGGTDVGLSVLAAVVFALGLSIGGGSYARRGRGRLGAVHIVGALGWLTLAAGTAISNTPVLVGGGVLLVASTAALVALVWEAPW
jgi:hypothetical protein